MLFFFWKKLSETKDVFQQLGSWNIVKNKLIPLLVTNRDDKILSFEICNIFKNIQFKFIYKR